MLPGSNVKIRFNAPFRNMRFSNENVQLLGGKLYGRIFTQRELSSRRECYPDFASRQDSHQDPGEEFFPWRDPGEYRFLGGILAEIRGGNFSREGSRRENGPPRQDPGGIPVSAGNLGGIPARSRYLFYKGKEWTMSSVRSSNLGCTWIVGRARR